MRLSDHDSAKDVAQDASQDSTKDASQDSAKDSSKDALLDFRIGRNASSKITNARTGHFKNFFMC